VKVRMDRFGYVVDEVKSDDTIPTPLIDKIENEVRRCVNLITREKEREEERMRGSEEREEWERRHVKADRRKK